jgi:hypothetical protein
MKFSTTYWVRWSRWRKLLNDTTFAHGADLVEELGTPIGGKSGLADNVYAAEKILEELESLGYISRGKLAPTFSQRAWEGAAGGGTGTLGLQLRAYGWVRVKPVPAAPEDFQK